METEDTEKFIVVALNLHTASESEAAQAVEILSRILVGLSLNGLACNLSVHVVDDDEDEYEYEDQEGEGESDG